MRTAEKEAKQIRARAFIEGMGGSAALARLLKYGKTGTATVDNWKRRGIPAQVQVDHPEIFSGLAKIVCKATCADGVRSGKDDDV